MGKEYYIFFCTHLTLIKAKYDVMIVTYQLKKGKLLSIFVLITFNEKK